MTNLYEKYKALQYQDLPALNPLSFILTKAELGRNLTPSEWQWLEQHHLPSTIGMIKSQEDYRNSIYSKVRAELVQLKKNQYVYFSVSVIPDIDSEIALVLYKVNAQERLSNTEIRFVGQGYHKFLDFNDRKQRNGILEDIPFDEKAESILLKLDKKIQFSSADMEWISEQNALSFLSILRNQLSFLQNRYKAVTQDGSIINELSLCLILQKLEEKNHLSESEFQYLRENGFDETITIAQQIEFSVLKQKYQATQIQEDNVNHHLYKVLKKLEAGISLPEADVNYLKKRKLSETLKFVYKKQIDSLMQKINHGHGLRPDDVAWCCQNNYEEIVFLWLKKDYEVEYRKDMPESLLYAILKKLEASQRLTDEEVVWLQAEKLLKTRLKDRDYYVSTRIFIAHHTLEAKFYESEFQHTKNHWNLASASAHWRKAERPEHALDLTGNLNLKQIKPAKLKAALLTTRGGALRDSDRFDEAEKCAVEAIQHYPNNHNPYTLMGALCYDRKDYEAGDKWFEEAVKRGAKFDEQDAEIKRILRKIKGQERNELIDHLLKRDPHRFAWVKKFV
ncbi:hypothetical protein B0F87_112103 [Methylobacter tundripaludum]|uniref:Uncharacterized protein n=1 Tax=Methylobacter tundripaludum TaxID=173365 RepID=A0A2S6H975_9GAMM|nr:hypothetical protein [Methylobacter tundripaludum]PPK74052.1 hypothetical protein B0F87_112103 [Methylobacter tundripaludum]